MNSDFLYDGNFSRSDFSWLYLIVGEWYFNGKYEVNLAIKVSTRTKMADSGFVSIIYRVDNYRNNFIRRCEIEPTLKGMWYNWKYEKVLEQEESRNTE